MTYHATGIVLRREAWRESARLYTVYTREAGKLLAVGRGTRKILSKLAAHLEPYSAADLFLAKGRKLETVCGAMMTRSPEAFAGDPSRHAAAAFVADAVDHFVKFGERDERLWDLIDRFFAECGFVPVEQIRERLGGFVWDFMSRLGYQPKLGECSECGRDIRAEVVRFMPAGGTATCRECPESERALAGAVLMPAAAPSFEGALSFLEAHLDRPLASLPILKALLSLGAEAHKVLSFQRPPKAGPPLAEKLEPSTETYV